MRISCSGDNVKSQTIAEEAVDQLQENEKLVAGNYTPLPISVMLGFKPLGEYRRGPP